jgi:hypothetical protein
MSGPSPGGRYRGVDDEDLEEYLADLKYEIDRVQVRLNRNRTSGQ